MCANPDKKTTEEFRKRTGRQRAYKVIAKATARPVFFSSSHTYHPGHNVDHDAVKTYLGYIGGTERGFHCYLGQADAERHKTAYTNFDKYQTVVCVTFNPGDVIAVESSHYPEGGRRKDRQIVVRALDISARAWKQAGLPAQEN